MPDRNYVWRTVCFSFNYGCHELGVGPLTKRNREQAGISIHVVGKLERQTQAQCVLVCCMAVRAVVNVGEPLALSDTPTRCANLPKTMCWHYYTFLRARLFEGRSEGKCLRVIVGVL